MIYICSDIHGLYDRWQRLLKAIDLKEDDTIYVLGDMIDRGPDGIEVLRDMMHRDNVIPFMGNHEHMMLMYLAGYDRISWTMECNGGMHTLRIFRDLPKDEQDEILEYLENCWIVRTLEINGHRYSLSHIGVTPETEDRRAYFSAYGTDVYDLQKMVWGEYPYDLSRINYQPAELCPTTFISGHKFTRRWRGYIDDDTVYIRDFENGCRYIDIDCGCAFGNGEGYLACLRIPENGEIDLDNILYIQ